MFEIENDSDWSQYKLAGIDIIDIFYLGLPPGVDLYVSKTTSTITNDRTHWYKANFQESGYLFNSNWEHVQPVNGTYCSLFYLTSSGTLAL
jgi:hypothetical protein